MQQQRIFQKKRKRLVLTSLGKGRLRVEGDIIVKSTEIPELIRDLTEMHRMDVTRDLIGHKLMQKELESAQPITPGVHTTAQEAHNGTEM